MDHSLINPNQIRANGIPVSDNPFDVDRPFGIDHEDLFVPFQAKGATVFFTTSVPSDDELDSCPMIVLTDGDVEWDPRGVDLCKRGPATDVAVSRQLAAVTALTTGSCWGETDLVLSSVSPALVPQVSTLRAIGSVNVHDVPTVSSAMINTRHSAVTPERASRLFGIGLNKAKDLLRVTTQRGIRTAVHPITRRYRVDHLDLHRNRLQGQWYCDWLSSGVRSLGQSTGAFIFTNGRFTEVYPKDRHTHGNAADALNEFIDDVGIPVNLRTDMAPEFT
jgi:hypothetical protein